MHNGIFGFQKNFGRKCGINNIKEKSKGKEKVNKNKNRFKVKNYFYRMFKIHSIYFL